VLDAVVIGAGPAGLAVSRELGRRGVQHVVLERGSEVGHCWVHTYDSLSLHTGKHMSTLPGLRFPRGTPLFPARDDFIDYLNTYARRFALPLQLGTTVHRVENAGGWRLQTSAGEVHARALIAATGLMSNPVRADLPGSTEFRGRVLHSVDYRRPTDFAGNRVLVIGVGNSGGEIASELGRAGIDVSIAVRSGANVVPLRIAGLPTQYLAFLMRKLPRTAQERVVQLIRKRMDRRRPPVLPRPNHSPLDAIPIIGFHLVDAIAAGQVRLRGAIERLTPDGVRFADGSTDRLDVIILATGFRAALQPLAHLIRTDTRGFALRSDRVTSIDQPALYLVGQNYDSTGGLRNISLDAPLAASRVEELLR
jgi:cation diffusion facilitator CzcD-associated flavoprotein CzcO